MRKLTLGILLVGCAGCSLIPARPAAKTDFDFGPPTVQASNAAVSDANVTVYPITAPAWMDHSSMYYRLAYKNAASPIPYTQSEWVMSPALLLTQRLRSGFADASNPRVRQVSERPEARYALRAELLEFDQIFDQPGRSRAVLRLQATLETDEMRMQRTFSIEKPAHSADAVGGAKALAQCADELTAAVAEWVVSGGSEAPDQTVARR